jgi:hypothetical protein
MSSIIVCDWCSAESTAEDWNKTSYEQCKNRKMKRAFKPVEDTVGNKLGAKFYYMCPKCKQWVNGAKLRVQV